MRGGVLGRTRICHEIIEEIQPIAALEACHYGWCRYKTAQEQRKGVLAMKCSQCQKEIAPVPSNEVQQREVEWYQKFGVHPARIKRDGSGQLYVIGDWGWNRDCSLPKEYIEGTMQSAGIYEGNN